MNIRDRHRVSDRNWAERTPEAVEITSGRWRCEVRGDEIAEITFDGSLIARAVRAVARDPDWRTVPISVTARSETENRCVLHVRMDGFGVELDGQLTMMIDGTRCGFDFAATMGGDTMINRVGLVVLHPPELAGTTLTVRNPSGQLSDTTFPVTLSSWQPAQDIAGLQWIHDGVRVSATFAGDVFEMEDQRNWTDASYKTYSRPLELPFPYRIDAAERIAQSVTFDAVREHPCNAPATLETIELVETGREVPAITLGASGIPDVGNGSIPDGVGAVLVELDIRDDGWPAILASAIGEAGTLPLDVRLIGDDPDRIARAVRTIADTTKVLRIGAYSARTHVSETAVWSALSAAVVAQLPDAALVGGSRAHYTELNRTHHRLPPEFPGLTFSMTPQMHAGESRQLVESIGMQVAVLTDSGRIADGRPVHVGPITLRPRFNDVAGGDEALPADLAAITDPRQAAPALGPWTVASYAAICGAGVTVGSVCYFEVAGPRGLGTVEHRFPVADAVASIAALHGRRLVRPATLAPPGWWLVGGVAADGSVRLLAASLADDDDAATVRFAGREHSLRLAPYQVADMTLN